VLCVGHASRLAEYVQRQAKQYRAGVMLGAISSTDDSQGVIEPTPGASPIEPARVARALTEFVGDIRQSPPTHSAVHVNGQRAYTLARAGEQFELPPRQVSVRRIEMLAYDWPRLELDIECGSGTYIRSLARDIGVRLGVGGYCESLVRTAVGAFIVDQAVSPDDLLVQEHLIAPASALADMQRIMIDQTQMAALANGNTIELALPHPTGEAAAVDNSGRLLAIGEIDTDAVSFHPRKVFIT
jgi:tRNA pseudouridine55 synthase